MVLVIDWLHDSEDRYAEFMRTNGHTSFENIFRVTKFQEKLEKAYDWQDDQEAEEQNDGVNMGAFAFLRG